MKSLLFIVSFLISAAASAQEIPPTRFVHGTYSIQRSYYQPIEHKTGYNLVTETICSGDVQVPVYDFRAGEPDGYITGADIPCPSMWDQTVVTPNLVSMVVLNHYGSDDQTAINAYLSFSSTDYDAVKDLQQPVGNYETFLGSQNPVTPLMNFSPTEQMGLSCADSICTPTGIKYQFIGHMQIEYK